MTLFGGRVVVPLSGETRSYFYTLVIGIIPSSLGLKPNISFDFNLTKKIKKKIKKKSMS
jgi:hypothetical protein